VINATWTNVNGLMSRGLLMVYSGASIPAVPLALAMASWSSGRNYGSIQRRSGLVMELL
jgi:hypothetical protein